MPLVNFSGIASGIDSQSLIKAILDQRRNSQIKPLEKKVTQFTETNSALDELKTKLATLKSAVDKFRTINGGAVGKTAFSSNENVASAVASNAAATGNSTVTVTSLAKNATISLDDRYGSATSSINSSINNGASAAQRTVSFTIGTGSSQETVDIELTSATTAEQFVNAFNSESNQATASLVNVGSRTSPSYAISITSKNSGTEQGEIAISVGSEIQTAGSGAFLTNTLSQATDAQFSIAGISGTITRSSNTVGDVVEGLTFTLQGTGSAVISVGNDTTTTTSNLQDFVDAYNDLRTYINENDAVIQEGDGDNRTNIFGPLSGTSLDQNILTSIRSALSTSSTSGGIYNTLFEYGIKTERDGSLSLNTSDLTTRLAEDPTSLSLITQSLGDTLASVDGTIAQYTRFNGLIDLSVNINANQIKDLNDRRSDIEKSLAKQEFDLTSQFARLESLIGRLNSQQSQLSSLLPR